MRTLRVRLQVVTAVAMLHFSPASAAQSDDGFAVGTKARSYALVIGVSDYDGDGKIGSSTPQALFRDLPNACNDAREIGESLIRVGWKRSTDPALNEVEVLCDADLATLKQAIGILRLRVSDAMDQKPEDGESDATFLLYFSGHGVEIDKYTYLFGRNAAPDLDKAARIVMKSGPPSDPFPETALDLYRDFYLRFGDMDVPLVVILDACRENPVPAVLAQKILRGRPIAPPMGVPDKESVRAQGVHRLFATSAGAPAYDGLPGQHSFFAESLLAEIKADTEIGDAFRRVQRDVIKRTQTIYGVSRRQVPDMDPGATQVCFYRCSAGAIHTDGSAGSTGAGAAASPPPARSTSAAGPAPRIWRAAWQGLNAPDRLQAAPGKSQEKRLRRPNRAVLYQRSESWTGDRSRLIALDLFYCKGQDAGEEVRYASALEAGSALAAYAKTLDQQGGESGISRVSLRSWGEPTNAGLGNRHVENEGVIDDDLERDLLAKVNSLQRLKFLTKTKGSSYAPTPNYLGLFVCSMYRPVEEGRQQARAKVFLHVAPGQEKSSASALDQIVAPILGVQTEPPEALTNLPDRTTVKYFYTEDRDHAFALAAALDERRSRIANQSLPQAARTIVTPLANESLNTKAGVIEIWIGKNDRLR